MSPRETSRLFSRESLKANALNRVNQVYRLWIGRKQASFPLIEFIIVTLHKILTFLGLSYLWRTHPEYLTGIVALAIIGLMHAMVEIYKSTKVNNIYPVNLSNVCPESLNLTRLRAS